MQYWPESKELFEYARPDHEQLLSFGALGSVTSMSAGTHGCPVIPRTLSSQLEKSIHKDSGKLEKSGKASQRQMDHQKSTANPAKVLKPVQATGCKSMRMISMIIQAWAQARAKQVV